MQSELNPCAHCASNDVEGRESVSDYYVACCNCGARTGLVYLGASDAANAAKKREAIAAWNTRASDADLTEALRAAEEREKALREDKVRLDYLDKCNHRLNSRYGTSYGWKLVLNHNVTRLMLDTPSGMAVDLHDTEGGSAKFTSCRKAIDESMLRAALAGAKP